MTDQPPSAMARYCSSGSVYYLVRDGARTFTLAVEHNEKLFCYVPNVHAFVYNGPLSVDFLIDHNHRYDPISTQEAAQIVGAGRIGWIDADTSDTLMEWATSEPRRLRPEEVFGSLPAKPETLARHDGFSSSGLWLNAVSQLPISPSDSPVANPARKFRASSTRTNIMMLAMTATTTCPDIRPVATRGCRCINTL